MTDTLIKLIPHILYPQSLKIYIINKLQRMPYPADNTGSSGTPVAKLKTYDQGPQKSGQIQSPIRNYKCLQWSVKYSISNMP